MSAPVEQRHRDAAQDRLFGHELGDAGLGNYDRVCIDSLAQLLADTEAAEAEKSTALRAEFAACVRALRLMASYFGPPCDEGCPGDDACECSGPKGVESALSGPLAREVKDA